MVERIPERPIRGFLDAGRPFKCSIYELGQAAGMPSILLEVSESASYAKYLRFSCRSMHRLRFPFQHVESLNFSTSRDARQQERTRCLTTQPVEYPRNRSFSKMKLGGAQGKQPDIRSAPVSSKNPTRTPSRPTSKEFDRCHPEYNTRRKTGENASHYPRFGSLQPGGNRQSKARYSSPQGSSRDQVAAVVLSQY